MAFGAKIGVADDSPAPVSKPAASPDANQGGGIQSDPEALKCIDYLKSKGYSPDEVADAMSDGAQGNPQPSPAGAAATKAAPLQIPGMG